MKKVILLVGLVCIGYIASAQVYDLDAEIIHTPLQFGTRRVVNTIDTTTSDSSYVYLSICNAPGNTNKIQYKGAYGTWQVLGSSNTVNVGDRIKVIGDFYIMSTATTDTAYLFIQKQ